MLVRLKTYWKSISLSLLINDFFHLLLLLLSRFNEASQNCHGICVVDFRIKRDRDELELVCRSLKLIVTNLFDIVETAELVS